MTELHDPFVNGDCIWWERRGVPIMFYTKIKGDYKDVNRIAYTFEQLYNTYRRIQTASGPYRLAQSENWSGVDFTNPDSRYIDS